MSLADFYISLRARWRIALLVFLTVVAVAAVFTFTRKSQYTAVGSIVLDVKSPDPIAGMVLPGMTSTGYMATQINVVQSERVALRAIATLGLAQDEERKAMWREVTEGVGSFESWLAGSLLNRLEVIPTRDSNVLSVSFTSPDPEFAARVTNAWIKAYVDTTLELRVEPAKQYNSFFDERSKQLREELEKAQSKLSAYQREKGIVATDERLDVENIRLTELSSQLVQLQAVANESGGRQRQSANNAARMQEVFNSPVLVSMTTELSRAEALLNERRERLGQNHPEMAELQGKIKQLRSGIEAETRRVASSLRINDEINQTRLAQTQAAIDEQRTKLLRLKGLRDESAVLERDVENARRSYDLALTRLAQTSVESQTTQTNVSVLREASTPPYPSSPRVRLNLTIAMLVGALLAAAAAVAREMLDRRLRTDQDVVEGLGLPLLGVLPNKALGTGVQSSRRLRLTLSPTRPRIT
jgi:succinoglycan biosynthesis transport protein ExoP